MPMLKNQPALHYDFQKKAGQPTIVFVNSLGTDFRVWDGLLPLLGGGHAHLLYDKRGHGLSDLPPGEWGMVDHVRDLETLLDTLEIKAAVICGLSVGGMIAQALAARRPDLTRALILMDTAAKIGTADMWNARIDAIRSHGLASIAGPILERWFTAEFREHSVEFPRWRNMLIRTPEEGYMQTCGAIRDTDLSAATQTLELPCLAIAGDQDGSTPPELVRKTAAMIEGARFEIVANAGHLPCVEQPAVTAAMMNDFLMELDDD